MSSRHVIVVGGGVVGAFTAYYLLKKGWSVTVVERDRLGRGASGGNCGLIVPNHILPLNSFRTLAQGLLWMVRKDAPLYIKPSRANPGLLKWLLQFAWHARPEAILKAIEGRHQLLQSSFDLYQEFMAAEKAACGWNVDDGSLHVYQSATLWAQYRKTNVFLNRFGIQAEPMDGKAVHKFASTLSPQVVGGWHYRHTAHLRPEYLMSELRRILSQRGARILENCSVDRIRSENGNAVAMLAAQKKLTADAYVLSTGAWTPYFEKALGCRVPIQPGKGYSITLNRSTAFPKIPCFFEEQRVVSTPWTNDCRLGGTMEFSGFDNQLDRRRLVALNSAYRRYVDCRRMADIKEEWCGFRPMTVDGLPFIGRSPRLGNVYLAAGHNMIGISAAPATGKLMAELLEGATPHIDPHPFRVDRLKS